MKQLLLLLSIGLFTNCQLRTSNDNLNQDIQDPRVEKILPVIKPRFVENLSKLDESKFPSINCDTIDNIRFDYLPKIKGIQDYEMQEGKYVCNRTYSNNFKTYILSVYEGGDYGPMIILYNCKKDSVLASKMIYQVGSYENDYKHKYSTVFLNDSTFQLKLESQGMAMDSTGYIPDSMDFRMKTEIFEIASNGGFKLLKQEDMTWRKGRKN
jgi:hypothetical protein